jgi:hypothetical protein
VSCIIDHYCLRFARVLVPVIVVRYIIDHYCLRFARVLVPVAMVSCIILKQ